MKLTILTCVILSLELRISLLLSTQGYGTEICTEGAKGLILTLQLILHITLQWTYTFDR